jgi:hypothetical protein
MDTSKISRELLTMMYDQYCVGTQVVFLKPNEPMIIFTNNVAILDSNDKEDLERCEELVHRMKICLSLFSNNNLTNAFLERIIFSTGSRMPVRDKAQNLPPANK